MRDPIVIAIVLIARACSGEEDPPPNVFPDAATATTTTATGGGGAGGAGGSTSTSTSAGGAGGNGGAPATTTATTGAGGQGGAGGGCGGVTCLSCADALNLGTTVGSPTVCDGADVYLGAVYQASCSIEVCSGVCGSTCSAGSMHEQSCKTCLKNNSGVIQACEAH